MLLFVIPYIIIIYSLRKEVDIMKLHFCEKPLLKKWGISEKTDTKNYVRKNRIDGTEKIWSCMDDTKKMQEKTR